ncbi:uncharacterized protein LOC143057297 isoform X2 [Mytilus galloprovincialis]|uniref:uncharacterized protein LOC143057297 isoform X2 n=1 Tax=Mytilus galloprovincialis TaxID=29158 RepID=UPI003F7C7AC3
MPKLKRNCWTLPYHRKRRAIKQLQHVKSMRKKVLASTKPEEFTVEVADSGVVIGTGTIHDSYWSVTIPEGGNHFNGDSNSCTSQDIFENEHTDLDLEIVVDENSAEKPCIQIIGEVQNCFEKIDIEHLDENLAKEHGIIIDGEEENSFETIKDVGIGNEMVSSESNELSRVISPLASYNDNNYNAVQTDCLSKTVQYVEIGSEMVSSLIDNSYNTDQTGGLRITENIENSSETVQYIEIGSERELSKNNELYRVVSPITSLINNSHNTVQTDGVRITRNKQNSFETGQYAEHVEIGSVMASSENNELNNVDSPFPSYNSYSAVLYKNNSYTTVQTDISQQDCNELGGVIAPVTLYNSSSYRTVQTDISQQDYHDGSESNELGGVIAPVTLYNNSSYRTVQTDISQQDCNDVSESNELGGVIAPVTLYNNSSYNTVQTEASQQDYHDGSDTDSTVSNDFVTVKVELPDGTTELLETIPYENYPTVQSEHADIDLYGSHTDNVNIHNNKIMSESELFRITHNVNAIPDQSMPGTSTQSFIRDNDQVEGGQDNYQEWDIGMLPFVMETMKEQENTQSLLDKNMQKAKKKKVQEAKLKAGICSSNRCCPGCDTFGNHVRKPPKTKKTKTTKIDSALDEEKSRSPKAYRRKFPMERCDFCPMVFRGAWPKYKKQNHIIAEHCSKDVLEELRKRKKKNEVLSEPKSKFVQYSKKPKYEMIRLDLEFPDYLYGMECIECNKVIREEHFRKFLKCTKCNYSSMCSRAYIEHMINMHGTRNRSSNKYVPCSSRFMECACGFVHIEGNKMAEHINLCQQGKKSCEVLNIGYSFPAKLKHGKKRGRKPATESLVEDDKLSKEFDTTRMKTENDAGTLDNTPLPKGKALDTCSHASINHNSSPYLTDIQHVRMATEDDSGTLDNIPLQKGNALDIYSITHSSSPYLTDIQHIRKEEQEEELVNSNLNKQASNETSDKDRFLNTNLSIKATQGINGQIVHEQLPHHMLQQSEDEFKKVINYYNPLFYHSYSLPYWCEPEKSKSSIQKDSIFIDKNKSKSYLLNEQNLLIPSPSTHMKDVEITVVTLNQLPKKTKTNASEGDQNGFNQVSIMPKINEKGQLVLAIDKKGSKMTIKDTEDSKKKIIDSEDSKKKKTKVTQGSKKKKTVAILDDPTLLAKAKRLVTCPTIFIGYKG